MSAGQPSSLDLDALDLNPKALEGLTVVITGTLPNLSRKQAQELVERAGGKVTGSISSKTNLLVAGDKAGSKLKKAEELGVEVLHENGLMKRISNQSNKPKSVVEAAENENNKVDAIKYTNSAKDKYREGDLKGALLDLNRALAINSSYIDALYNRGIAKNELGDIEGACIDWTNAVKMGDDEARVLIEHYCQKCKAGEITKKTILSEDSYNPLWNKSKAGFDKGVYQDKITKSVRCQGDYLATVIDYLKGSDEEIAIALGYYSMNEQGITVPLVDEFKIAKDECTANHHALGRYEEQSFDIFKGRLIVSDDHFGIVFVPKRLVVENKEFYEGSDLDDFDIEFVMAEELMEKEEAEEYIRRLAFKEPMMVQSIMNMVYINPWNLEWLEGECWFTYEELADYWGLRYQDCDNIASTWRDG